MKTLRQCKEKNSFARCSRDVKYNKYTNVYGRFRANARRIDTVEEEISCVNPCVYISITEPIKTCVSCRIRDWDQLTDDFTYRPLSSSCRAGAIRNYKFCQMCNDKKCEDLQWSSFFQPEEPVIWHHDKLNSRMWNHSFCFLTTFWGHRRRIPGRGRRPDSNADGAEMIWSVCLHRKSSLFLFMVQNDPSRGLFSR